MDGARASNRWSISDEVAVRVNYSTVMRALCLAWLYPAVRLVWVGFGSVGLRSVEAAERSAALDAVQAVAVLLAIFGSLVGAIWAVRAWDYLPASELIRTRRRWTGPAAHLATAPLALAAAVAMTFGRFEMPLLVVAACAGCHALLLVPRWLLRAPIDRAFPLAAFAAAVVFQITMGWIHVRRPDGAFTGLVLVEGLILAWAAVAAARAIGATAEAPVGVTRTVRAESGDDQSNEAVDLLSSTPALPSLPEPAVGR